MSDRPATSLLAPAALVAGAYAYGSVPFVYSLARTGGVDLRDAGSGTMGGSNLWQQVGPAAGAAGWLLDASKGALPVAVGRRMGLSHLACGIGSAAGVAGQCWPVFLGFDGGRGVSAILGAAALLAPRELAAALIPMVGGCLLRAAPLFARSAGKGLGERARLAGSNSKAVPLSVGASILVIPLLAAVRRRPRGVVVGTGLNSSILLLRRLTARSGTEGRGGDRARRVISRLLYDRDAPR